MSATAAGAGSGIEARDVVVVGAGIAGIAATVRLRADGHDVLVLEAAHEVGGTWRENTYPGAGCDVPSPLYAFSFAPNPGWTRTYARQPEILDYLRRTASEHDVTAHVRFGTRLLRADWNPERCRWRLETSTGPVLARWVVAASGPLHHPSTPALPGLEGFRGAVFHSARWDRGHDLAGRRVAVVGSGASAVQLVPEIAPLVERLVVLQRTPQWVLPKLDRSTTALERRLFALVPPVQKALRLGVHAGAELLALAVRRPWLLRPLQLVARRHLRRQVPDPVLRERLLPGDRLGCRRIIVSSDWYPTLARDHVTLAHGGVGEVRPGSVVDGEGIEHPVDTIVLATGFEAADPVVARWFHDARGVSMATHFAARGTRAHLGTTVAGFPNLFLLAGPNSFVYSSLITVIEAQVEHVARLLRRARDRRALRVELRRAAEQAFDDELRRRLTGTVWTTGCRSWFLDRTGRNTTMWPGTTSELRRRLRRADPTPYSFGRPEGTSPQSPVPRHLWCEPETEAGRTGHPTSVR